MSPHDYLSLFRENAPPVVYWPAATLLLLISIAIPLYFVADLAKKHEQKRINNNPAAIKKWFRSHWPTMPDECRIIGALLDRAR